MESPTPQPAPGSATFMEGCKDSLPIVISYIPVAFAFGLNATRLGFSPLESVFFSCIIYAGASQFVITAMLAAGSSLWVAALTVMAMDVRHVLYGPSLRSRIIQRLQKSKTALWAFGLTDEVFAAATAKLVRNNRRWSENWMIGIAFSSWSSWVFGTVIGAFSGSGLLQGYPAVEAALGFMLPALFMSFLLASFQRKQSLCVTAALVGALAGVTLFSIPVAILAGIVCGCLTALIQAFWQGAPNYCFRYLPLRLRVGNARPTKRGAVGILLDTIGIASICALLVVSTAPEVMHDTRRFVPTLVGFAVLGASFYKTRSIIIPTLLSALAYGLAWKVMAII